MRPDHSDGLRPSRFRVTHSTQETRMTDMDRSTDALENPPFAGVLA